VTLAREEGDWEVEEDDKSNKGSAQCNGAESTDNVVGVSSSRRGNMDRCNQRRSFVHLLVNKPAHDGVALVGGIEERDFPFKVVVE